jgi:3-phosphoshikimate 1-carboxyvinyltransferase
MVVERPLKAEDIELFLEALKVCGFEVESRGADVHLRPLTPTTRGGEIFCGNAGTLFRFLVAVLTVLPGRWRLDGTPRLRQRTVAPLLACLRTLGAEIRCLGQEGFAPLEIEGGTLRGGKASLDAGQSSQFLSALLLAGQRAQEVLEIRVEALTSAPYLDLSLESVEAFGGRVERPAEDLFLVRPSVLALDRARVEGDFSAACYGAAAAALGGGPVRIEGVRRASRQGDRRFLEVLERMGATVRWLGEEVVEVEARELQAVTEDFSDLPDQVPTLAALAPFARGTTRITNVAHLRIKESDRLAAMATQLGRLGVPVDEGVDFLVIDGVWAQGMPDSLPAVEVEVYDDHRIAMSLALVGLRRGGVSVRDPGVVAKSYPDFWLHLQGLIAK